MVFLLTLISVFVVSNIVIDQKDVNTNWNYKSCIRNVLNHAIFCKIIDFSTPNNLFKGF